MIRSETPPSLIKENGIVIICDFDVVITRRAAYTTQTFLEHENGVEPSL